MRKLTSIFLGVFSLFSAISVQAQDLNKTDSPGIKSTKPLVCKLLGPKLQARKAALEKEVFVKAQEIQEQEDGYLFLFEDKGSFLAKLTDYMLAEQKCCTFFQFDLRIKAEHQGIELKVSGPPEVKEMIRGMLVEGASR